MTCIEIAIETLRRHGKPLKPLEIYYKARELGIDMSNLTGKTPESTLQAHVYVSLKKPDSPFVKVEHEGRGVLVALKSGSVGIKGAKSDELERAEVAKIHEMRDFKERDLHALLAKYVKEGFPDTVYSKTINHQSSKKGNKGEDKWLYPDMVGVAFEYTEYEQLEKFLESFDKKPIKIYSFEIKRTITMGNFREYFFQAVSNSSWANYGYLVALDINWEDTELKELIQKTSNSFGIGVISLNGEDVARSTILVNARFRENIDFKILNDLCSKNSDIEDFIGAVVDFDLKKEERFKEEFDRILSDKEMSKYTLERHIRIESQKP